MRPLYSNSLHFVSISLGDLEIIHENVPSLRALKLEWVNIKRGSGYPSNIVPATCLTTFHFTVYDIPDLNTHISFYKYIKQKYVNAINIKHKDSIRYSYDYRNRELLGVNGYRDFLELAARRRGYSRFNRMQDETDSFEVVHPVDLNVLISRMTTTDLDIHLSQPSQFWSIHTLILNNTEPNTPDVLKYMPVLTTLKLHFTRHNDPLHIDLTPYFNGCPNSVKSFDIDCFQVEFDQEILRPCYIESLSINCNDVSSCSFSLISIYLPTLLRLKLADSMVSSREFIVLDTKHPLEEFTFVLNGRNPLCFSFKDKRDHFYYLCNSGDTRLATWDDVREIPTMAVVSYIPRRVVIDGQDSIRVVLD
jgi:hypothetical protein